MAFMQHREKAFHHLLLILNAVISEKHADLTKALSVSPSSSTCCEGSGDCGDCSSVNSDQGQGECNKGGWSTNSSNSNQSATSEFKVAPLAKIVSVNIKILDEEHELCAAALKSLVADRDVESLQQVLIFYEQHFMHEEKLLDTHLYNSVPSNGNVGAGGFSADTSARASHFEDHKRLIRNIEEELERLQCSGNTISSNFVDKVLRDFESHANRYDDAYAERLSIKLLWVFYLQYYILSFFQMTNYLTKILSVLRRRKSIVLKEKEV